MDWNWKDISEKLLSGAVLTTILGIIAKKMDWVRFGKKDSAEVNKIQSEAAVDLAEVNAKKIADEIKISNNALEWSAKLWDQLDKANQINDRRQQEIDRLHGVILNMRQDFEKRIQELEDALEISQQQLNKERQEVEILRKQIKDGSGR